jgi:Arylsulfotransferase (ASST)
MELSGRMFGSMGCFVCSFQGQPHLCFAQHAPKGSDRNHILNASYDAVLSISPDGSSLDSRLEADLHEFIIIQGSSAPSTPSANVYEEDTAIISSIATHKLDKPFRLAKCNLTIEWVGFSVFQERRLVGNNEVLFQWNSLEHVPLEDSDCPGNDGIVEAGDSQDKPFDHFHMNAVDKDEHGDYYVSGRHTSTLYKVSGRNGSILWQVGVDRPDFKISSEVQGFHGGFAFQHHLRYHPDYPGADVDNRIVALSLYDNANNRYDYTTRTAEYSSGKLYLVNERNHSAILKEAYPLYRDHKHQLSTNQGSFQLLPNGNRILGGGNIQEIIEWQPGNPEPVFRAHWGDWELEDGSNGHKVNSYRSMRFEWHGHPSGKPAVFAFAPECGANVTVYASWNGATEIDTWIIWGGAAEEGPFQRIGAVRRSGFESNGTAPFSNYVYAVALDARTVELGRSEPVRVAVPHTRTEAEQGHCGAARCKLGFNYTAHARRDCPPAQLVADLEPDPPILKPQPGSIFGMHCDPCFSTDPDT